MIIKQWRLLATAIMFLTRIPVGRQGSGEPSDLAASTQYFPLVGILCGVLTSIVFTLANLLWSSDIAVAVCLASAVILTGAFHEDGLADVADSAGAWTQEQKLKVMRDSRVGTYGALALVMVVLLKFVTLSSIAELVGTSSMEIDSSPTSRSVWIVFATLTLAHVLGRWSTLPLIFWTPYAREESANKVFAQGVTKQRLLVGSSIALAVIAVCATALGSVVFYAFACACIATFVSRHWFMRSIGGITGDCLGATNQVVELLVYLCVAGMLI